MDALVEYVPTKVVSARMGIHTALFLTLSAVISAANDKNTILLSELPQTLNVELDCIADVSCTNALSSGDTARVSWWLNENLTSELEYSTFQINLCYSDVDTQGRPWRKGSDNVKVDKQCNAYRAQEGATSPTFVAQDLRWDNTSETGEYLLKVTENQASGAYFMRVYAKNSENTIVAYGSSVDTPSKCDSLQQPSEIHSDNGVVQSGGCGYLAVNGDTGVNNAIIGSSAVISGTAIAVLMFHVIRDYIGRRSGP